MQRIRTFITLAALAAFIPCLAAYANDSLYPLSLSQLEQRLDAIDTELGKLAHYSLRGGIGAIGYRSQRNDTANALEWAEVDLGGEYPVSEIVLVPTIWRDTEKGFMADGFPQEFRIVAGTAGDSTGTVLAEYSMANHLLPRIAPLVIPVHGSTASWIRIEATRLSLRVFDQRYAFQLAELLIFSGEENIALRQPVKTSSNNRGRSGAWDQRFLVDGFMPYLMDSAEGIQSQAFVSLPSDQPTLLSLDLGAEYPLSRIQLHAVDQSDTVPQAYAGDLGIPSHLRIEGDNQPGFSNAVVLLDYERESINETGPIMIWRIPETTCRYVRFVPMEPGKSLDTGSDMFQIGFAEIELFSKGQNVALGQQVQCSSTMLGRRSLEALTDGNNHYGKILPIRKWLMQLARRHELETERPSIAEEIKQRYARQKAALNRMSWLAVLLAAGIGFTILIDRVLRQRQIARIRERFAADLHDELGANLHAIGLLGDLAKYAVHSPEELIETVEEIRALTERSGQAARHCADMQQADIFGKLPDDMHRTARRIMADLQYEISIEGEDVLEKLKPRTKADLFLFFKESLVNISRHSCATHVTINITAGRNLINMTITDNGLGMEGEAPASLKRRARLLGGRVSNNWSKAKGSCITLTFKPRRIGFGRPALI